MDDILTVVDSIRMHNSEVAIRLDGYVDVVFLVLTVTEKADKAKPRSRTYKRLKACVEMIFYGLDNRIRCIKTILVGRIILNSPSINLRMELAPVIV